MTFLDKKLENIFQMILKSSEPRTDGRHFSQFASRDDLLKSIHADLSSSPSNYHEMNNIHSVILYIWDYWLMSYSNVPSSFNEKYEYKKRPSDRSMFERIIRSIIQTFLIGIDEIVSRMYIHYQITYQENRELIKSVLNIGVQLPLDEMFEISQHRPDLPISISVYHDEIDRFIQVYLWVILILLKEGYQYDFEDGYLEDGICSICCDSSLKDIVRIVRGCGHSFCRSCFSRALTLQRKCPMCRREYAPVDISGECNHAVAVFLDERRKRDETVFRMKSNEKKTLIDFLKRNGVNMSNVGLWRDEHIQAFSTCGNLYTIDWKGRHECGRNGEPELHHATKKAGMASLCILHPTNCCLNCDGVFNVYLTCGHIICDAHVDQNKRVCPECSKMSIKTFKLNLPKQKIGE